MSIYVVDRKDNSSALLSSIWVTVTEIFVALYQRWLYGELSPTGNNSEGTVWTFKAHSLVF